MAVAFGLSGWVEMFETAAVGLRSGVGSMISSHSYNQAVPKLSWASESAPVVV